MKAFSSSDSPYAGLLCNFINRDFPKVTTPTKSEVIDILTDVLVGSKEVRYGTIPNPEGLVNIRNTIRFAMDNEIPIPMLIPWGSIKSDFSSQLDIAEVSAIKTLISLNDEVSKYYYRGIKVNIRLEDISGYKLFQLESNYETIESNSLIYCNDFEKLVVILGANDFITVIKESCMNNADRFNSIFNQFYSTMFEYLLSSRTLIELNPDFCEESQQFANLQKLGWKGIISYEQRNYYLNQYKKLYPDWDETKMIARLALYFTGSLTRHYLNMTGRPNGLHFIQLSFVAPIKGLPEGYNDNYLYYRTLPLSQARTHIPAWRAKGYFKIQGNNITSKITSFNDYDVVNNLIHSEIILQDDNMSVTINTSYLLIN